MHPHIHMPLDPTTTHGRAAICAAHPHIRRLYRLVIQANLRANRLYGHAVPAIWLSLRPARAAHVAARAAWRMRDVARRRYAAYLAAAYAVQGLTSYEAA